MEHLLSELVPQATCHHGLPPGFRFHPTDEELITFYLASKVFNDITFSAVKIAEVDLNRCEPWELPDVAKMGEREWYFFSLRDRKYPTGLRTNRATGAGYWKATGKDRQVYSAAGGALLGMKKTLVFYKGRAPRGEKTKWVMHEYRLEGDFSYRHTYKEEWVICRIFNKTEVNKNAFFQGQGFLPPNSTSLPALLEVPPILMECESHGQRNPFQENDSKILQLSPLMSINEWLQYPPPFSLAINTSEAANKKKDANITTNNPSQSMLLESLLAHQEQSPISKQCKREANFTHFQFPDDNLSWALDGIDNGCPLALEMDSNFLGITAATGSDNAAHEMSTSVAFDSAAFLLRLDGESWPLES